MTNPEYHYGTLHESDLASCPFEQFGNWYEEYRASPGHALKNAMILSTAATNAQPTSRVVLLKDYGVEGFTFFSNYQSAKGRHLDMNPKASMLFFWPELERQVIVGGEVERLSRSESESYFYARPFLSQVASACSDQSEVIESREALEARYEAIKEEFKNEEKVPMPEDWGGYKLIPSSIEFWQGRENRLNDRLIYERSSESSWKVQRLQP